MYIDYDFYTNVFKASPMEAAEFDALCVRACCLIDVLVNYRIDEVGFENLSNFRQAQIQKAVAAQVEYMALNGGIAFLGETGGVMGFTLGKFSIDSRTSDGVTLVSPVVQGLLVLSGMLYSGVVIC